MIKTGDYLKYAQEKEDPEVKKPTPYQFKTGNTYGKAGRPKGGGDWRTKIAQAMKDSAPQIIEKAIEMAEGGNHRMIKLLIDKVIPNRHSELLDHPALTRIDSSSTASLIAASENITNTLADNLITPEQALKAQQVVEGHMRILNAGALEERVRALEEKLNEI